MQGGVTEEQMLKHMGANTSLTLKEAVELLKVGIASVYHSMYYYYLALFQCVVYVIVLFVDNLYWGVRFLPGHLNGSLWLRIKAWGLHTPANEKLDHRCEFSVVSKNIDHQPCTIPSWRTNNYLFMLTCLIYEFSGCLTFFSNTLLARPCRYSLVDLREHIKKRPPIATTEKVQHYLKVLINLALLLHKRYTVSCLRCRSLFFRLHHVRTVEAPAKIGNGT